MKLASRSVSIRFVLEHWSSATNLSTFHVELKRFLSENSTNPNVLQTFDATKSFRITVETFNKTIQLKEKIDRIESLSYLPTKGNVNLNNPDMLWYYIEYYGLDTLNIPEQPIHILFGRWVLTIGFIIHMIRNNY